MKTRTFLGALLAGACLLSGCTSQRSTLEVGDPALVPVPRTPPPANTAVKYIRQKGDWYQLRISLDSTHPKLRTDGISYSMEFETEVTVHKYNQDTGEYELVPGGRAADEYRNVLFLFGGLGNKEVFMSPDSGTASGGRTPGLPAKNHTNVGLKFTPEFFGTNSATPDEMEFVVTAVGKVKPNPRDLMADPGASPVVVETSQKWRVKVLGRERAEFTRLK